MSPELTGFLCYLLVVLVVGLAGLRRTRDSKDYLLAGQKLGPFVVSLSERASGESSWLVLSLPGAALAAGLIEVWTALGCLSGIVLSWALIARPLRRASAETGAMTLPTLIQRRLAGGDTAEDRRWAFRLRTSASLIILFFFVFYVSAQFLGAGKVLHTTFGLEPWQGMLVGALLIAFYTVLGGFFAVAWTDVIQGLLMFATLVILPIVGIIELGGLEALRQGVTQHATGTELSWSGGKTGWAAIAAVIGGLSWGLGYLGQPHLLIRYMSLRDESQVPLARRIAYAWAFPAFFGALLLGFVGLAFTGGGLEDPEQIMPMLALQLLPAWLAGLFLSGAIAAMMSTADSQLLVCSSALTEDLYTGAARSDARKMLLLSRLGTLAVSAFAFGLALASESLIYAMVSFAWAGLSASFGPLLLFVLFRRKLHPRTALIAMWTGALVTVIGQNLPALDELLSVRITSFVAALLVLALGSRFDSRRGVCS